MDANIFKLPPYGLRVGISRWLSDDKDRLQYNIALDCSLTNVSHLISSWSFLCFFSSFAIHLALAEVHHMCNGVQNNEIGL